MPTNIMYIRSKNLHDCPSFYCLFKMLEVLGILGWVTLGSIGFQCKGKIATKVLCCQWLTLGSNFAWRKDLKWLQDQTERCRSFHVGYIYTWNTWHFDWAMLFLKSKFYMLCLIIARQSHNIVLEVMFYTSFHIVTTHYLNKHNTTLNDQDYLYF